MFLQISGVALLALSLSAFAQNFRPWFNESRNVDDIIREIQGWYPRVRTVEDLVRSLPEERRTNYVLMRETGSRHRAIGASSRVITYNWAITSRPSS